MDYPITGHIYAASNIESNSHIETPDSSLPPGAIAGVTCIISSGAGGGISYPPGASSYSCGESIGWSITCTANTVGDEASQIVWSTTLTDSCHATGETFGAGGSADGQGDAGSISPGADAAVTGVNQNKGDYPGNLTTPFGSTINSPSYTLMGGVYVYTITITTDSLLTSADTSQGYSATGSAYSDMVIDTLTFH